jgi:hypothetical protein
VKDQLLSSNLRFKFVLQITTLQKDFPQPKKEFTMRKLLYSTIVGLVVLALLIGLAPSVTQAASHREAPLISLDPTADITDFFMFRSYEAGKDDKIVFIMDVIPGEEPSSGPNYFNFDPNVLYAFNVDNNADGKANDVRFEIQFKTEFRGVNKDLGLFLSYVALPSAIDSLDHPGLGLRQTYTVTMVRGDDRTVLGKNLIAVPSNVGPRTMPNYESLAAQGIYTLSNGVRAFAGQRDDPFYIDLGAVFDTLNLRNPGTDMLSGFNVHTIALEVPATLITKDRKGPSNTAFPTLGAYANTYRRAVRVLNEDGEQNRENWVQVQRLANPLINEAIIGTKDKDRWNRLTPQRESVFLDYYTNPRLDAALQAVFGATASPLLDLRDVLLTYTPGNYTTLSELLRLNISVAPVQLASQNPLTVLGGDNAGWPNGRRPIDDVTDVAIRVIGGTNYLSASDAVQENDLPLPVTFPFLATPWDGRDRVHQNP